VPEIIFKDYNFIGVRHLKGLTNGWTPSAGDAVRKHARVTILSSSTSPVRDGVHSSSWLAPLPAFFGLVFFGFAALLFGAIAQISILSSVDSVCGCESRGVVAEMEDEMAKWQRWENGRWRYYYKALSPPL